MCEREIAFSSYADRAVAGEAYYRQTGAIPPWSAGALALTSSGVLAFVNQASRSERHPRSCAYSPSSEKLHSVSVGKALSSER